MKTNRIFLSIALFAATLSLQAQQVNTLYFLENAPMRHTINPAFQPVSNGYINFTPLGWMNIGLGNNSLTMSDVLIVDNDPNSPTYGQTITPLHPNADRKAFLKSMNFSTLFVNGDITLGLLNMGFRIKDDGYLTIGLNERIEMGITTPKSMMTFLFGGGMTDLTGGINKFDLTGLGGGLDVYSELGVGYSHRINEQWTVGGKLKLLAGHAHVGLRSKPFTISASTEQWRLQGNMGLEINGPINTEVLPDPTGKTVKEYADELKNSGIKFDQLVDYKNVGKMLTPAGAGAALDFGFTYKPIENLQITAAFTDLGFIYWWKGAKLNCSVDTVFNGVGEIDYGDPAYQDENGKFSTQILLDSVKSRMMGLLNGVAIGGANKSGVARMVSARLNVGLDANFWDNRIGIGILSATRLYNAHLYEEVTFGFAFRPVNWFNIAATYSLLNNGKYSNIGAGLSFMPYDGINMTLAMDYIPTSYAAVPTKAAPNLNYRYLIPDKTKMFNIALGFSICWGSNRRDKDKDGVWDKIDMCPNTPRGVAVDSLGCPLDEDHDGVPDYLDHCLGTPAAAIGFVDSVGCMLDTDSDGVEDYRDWCPGTPAAAIGFVDSLGCPLDTDGDGVADYIDLCPNTPAEAYGMVDSLGCPLDSDGDGILDYLDKCPGTPAEAYGMVDSLGCPFDTDGDGVPDYIDDCPGTPAEAYGKVDAHGCPLDSDGDGVPDYLDECPGTPAEAYGQIDAKGCPLDKDGDGVPDYLDECPNTPKAAAGHVDAKGCLLDSDNDGVPDYKDECPMVPGVKENKGCPEVKREVRNLLKKAMQGIEFETGKATIKKKSYPLLNQIAKIFIENSNYIIEVQGHTDNTGKYELNKSLSEKRANSVREYLIGQGVDFQRLTAVGYGPDAPIADNKTKAGRAKNRRVEFKISFEEITYETVLDHADPAPAAPADSTQVAQ